MLTKNVFLTAATFAMAIGCRQQPSFEMNYQGGHVTIYDTCGHPDKESSHLRLIIAKNAQGTITNVIRDRECDGDLLHNRVVTLKDGDTISPLFSKDEVRINDNSSDTFAIYRQDYRDLTKGKENTILRLTDNLLPCAREELEADIRTQFAKAQNLYDDVLLVYQPPKTVQQQ